jgi:hypothetical protein
MHARLSLTRATLRSLALISLLVFTIAFAGNASADTHRAAYDSGGSGDAADRPIFLEHFGLVPTNDGPVPLDPVMQGPSLVGSGPDREFVYVPSTITGILDETARSVDLIALTAASHAEYAEAPGLNPR